MTKQGIGFVSFSAGLLLSLAIGYVVIVVTYGVRRAEINAQTVFLNTQIDKVADTGSEVSLASLLMTLPDDSWRSVRLRVERGKVFGGGGREFRLVRDTVSGELRIWSDLKAR